MKGRGHVMSCVDMPWQALLYICSFWLISLSERFDDLTYYSLSSWCGYILVSFLCYISTENEKCEPCAFSPGLCFAVCVVLITCHQACWPGVQPCCVPQLSEQLMLSSVSLDCTPPLPLPSPTHRRYTRQDLLDIGAASSSFAGPLSPMLLVHLWHLGLACNQPWKLWRSRSGRNEPQKINVRINGSDRPVRQPPIDFISTHTDHLDTTTATVTNAKSHFSSYSHHQKQVNLICINPSQNYKGLTASVFNGQSFGPKEKHTEIVEFVKDEHVDILFLTATWMKTHGDASNSGFTWLQKFATFQKL